MQSSENLAAEQISFSHAVAIRCLYNCILTNFRATPWSTRNLRYGPQVGHG